MQAYFVLRSTCTTFNPKLNVDIGLRLPVGHMKPFYVRSLWVCYKKEVTMWDFLRLSGVIIL